VDVEKVIGDLESQPKFSSITGQSASFFWRSAPDESPLIN
jgi:hypothetical protein